MYDFKWLPIERELRLRSSSYGLVVVGRLFVLFVYLFYLSFYSPVSSSLLATRFNKFQLSRFSWCGLPLLGTSEPHSLSGTDCRYTFVPSSRLTVLKSHWSLSSSPLTTPNRYVSRHCRISVWQVISHCVDARPCNDFLSCYGALEIVCVLLLLLLCHAFNMAAMTSLHICLLPAAIYGYPLVSRVHVTSVPDL